MNTAITFEKAHFAAAELRFGGAVYLHAVAQMTRPAARAMEAEYTVYGRDDLPKDGYKKIELDYELRNAKLVFDLPTIGRAPKQFHLELNCPLIDRVVVTKVGGKKKGKPTYLAAKFRALLDGREAELLEFRRTVGKGEGKLALSPREEEPALTNEPVKSNSELFGQPTPQIVPEMATSKTNQAQNDATPNSSEPEMAPAQNEDTKQEFLSSSNEVEKKEVTAPLSEPDYFITRADAATTADEMRALFGELEDCWGKLVASMNAGEPAADAPDPWFIGAKTGRMHVGFSVVPPKGFRAFLKQIKTLDSGPALVPQFEDLIRQGQYIHGDIWQNLLSEEQKAQRARYLNEVAAAKTAKAEGEPEGLSRVLYDEELKGRADSYARVRVVQDEEGYGWAWWVRLGPAKSPEFSDADEGISETTQEDACCAALDAAIAAARGALVPGKGLAIPGKTKTAAAHVVTWARERRDQVVAPKDGE